ncbi:MAG: ABC transporter ATP-binding protein [Pseudomonadota bacterium]
MSDGAAPLLTLRGVGKRFGGGAPVLDGINLEIARGEFVSLLGPSGCGKSTLLRIIADLLEPSHGTVRWQQSDAEASSTSASGQAATIGGEGHRKLGFVFQDATLMPWANALDNVALPLRLEGLSKAIRHDRARDMLQRVGLADATSAYPRELSGGMRMRVSLARALITTPDVLLMDEPFAALDEITRNRLTDDLAALWERLGFTAIFVTHSVLESVYLSQRIVVMATHPGRIHSELTVPTATRDETFRMSSAYVAACREVSGKLKVAIAQ